MMGVGTPSASGVLSLDLWDVRLESLSLTICFTLLAATAFMAYKLRDIRRHPAPGERFGRMSLRVYMLPTVRSLLDSFLLAYVGWTLFYACLSLQHLGAIGVSVDPTVARVLNLVLDALTTMTSFFLVKFYEDLSTPNPIDRRERPSILTSYRGWVLISGALLLYQGLMVCARPSPLEMPGPSEAIFRGVYGLGQAIALYLVTGRLDSRTVNEHLDAQPGSPDGPLRPMERLLWLARRGGLFCGYAYASIQPLYPLFEQRGSKPVFFLVTAAFVLKLGLMAWVYQLMRRPTGGMSPSGIELLAYDMQSSATENMSSFERTFLRRHLVPEYVRHFKDRKIGYLGIEYARLNDYKRVWLRLSPEENGLLLRDVDAGSDALLQGLRAGDLVTSINDVPMGGANHLSDVLDRTASGEQVFISYETRRSARPGDSNSKMLVERKHCVVALTEFSHLRTTRRLTGGSARLGWKIRYNSTHHGVTCQTGPNPTDLATLTGIRSVDMGTTFETPDSAMLRFALEQMVHGERVLLFGHGLPGQRGGEPVEHTLRMACAAHPSSSPEDIGKLKLASPQEVTEPRRARLVAMYPNRFRSPVADRGVEGFLSVRGRQRVHCYDSQLRRLYAFFVDVGPGEGSILDVMRGMPLWREVEGEELVIFCGQASTGPGDHEHWRFHAGAFVRVKIEYEARSTGSVTNGASPGGLEAP